LWLTDSKGRWSLERDAFIAEVERKNAENEARRAAAIGSASSVGSNFDRRHHSRAGRQRHRFPPKDFTGAACAVIRGAYDALQQRAPKPCRTDVRATLKKTVLWFNEADERAGRVIEPEEREDVYAVLEERTHVARQKVLVEEIGEWREW